MFKEKVGMVTEEEKNRVRDLHERMLGLEELMISLSNQSNTPEIKHDLYEKIVTDMGVTKMKLQNWWDEMYEKYGWRIVNGGNWHIDFQTKEIFLEYNNHF